MRAISSIPSITPPFGITAPDSLPEQRALRPALPTIGRPLPPTVRPDPTGPAELVEARPRLPLEPSPPTHACVSSPEPTPQNTIISGKTRAPEPAALLRQGPPPNAPRSAAEASVIGPLDRPERVRSLLDLWLR
jgi:hypothetical protein